MSDHQGAALSGLAGIVRLAAPLWALAAFCACTEPLATADQIEKDTIAGDEAGDTGAAADTTSANDDASGCSSPCTLPAACVAGKCVAPKPPCGGACRGASDRFCPAGAAASASCSPSKCKPPTFAGTVAQTVSSLELAAKTIGCDLDGDGKADNVFGALAGAYPQLNKSLKEMVVKGGFNPVLHAPELAFKGKSFDIDVFVTIAATDMPCNMTHTAMCTMQVDNESFRGGPAGTCEAKLRLTAKIEGGDELHAKPVAGTHPVLHLPVYSGLDVPAVVARVTGIMDLPQSKWRATAAGMLCGSVTEADLNAAIAKVPKNYWGGLGLTQQLAKTLVSTLLKPDIDTNADGYPDSISFAALFTTREAKL